MIDLSPAATENVLMFLGYCNPGGVWFFGKEEGLSQMDREDHDANLIARGSFASTLDCMVLGQYMAGHQHGEAKAVAA